MPYLTIAVPQIPAESQDLFLSSWPKIAEGMKAVPGLKAVSGGKITAVDGKAVTEFQFLQTFFFETLEDKDFFFSSDFIKSLQAARAAKGDTTETVSATFQTSEVPANATPKKLTQFSRITIDESKKEELRAAWGELVGVLGQQTWGGQSVGEGPLVGLGLLGWDSLEDAGVAFKDPKAAAAFGKWAALGESKNVIAELTRY